MITTRSTGTGRDCRETYTMTPDEAFLQAVTDNPEDDTPRLVYQQSLRARFEEAGTVFGR